MKMMNGVMTMSNISFEETELIKEWKLKEVTCLGKFEDNDNSWHCLGCIIKNECIEKQKQRMEEFENVCL